MSKPKLLKVKHVSTPKVFYPGPLVFASKLAILNVRGFHISVQLRPPPKKRKKKKEKK